MPVKIPDALPATRTLMEENIFVMTEHRAQEQDIRPLHIGILNLMPMKIATETQLLRLLGNTPLQVEVTLLKTASYESSNTSREHLATFYRTFDEVKDELFDGLIITGAPVEQMPFEDVDYWEELTRIMAWSRKHVFSTLFICWASQAGLYYHHGIPKYPVPEKIFGVFEHVGLDKQCKLLRGFDDVFEAPQSRHTEVRREDIERCPELQILAESDEAGILLLASQDGREVYIAGHLEYDANTLELEYQRDLAKGMKMGVPRHYYPADDPSKLPRVTWRAHANLLFANWLNYYVYQETPYDLGKIG